MYKNLYLDIVEALKPIKASDNSQLFKHFDIWNRNVEFLEQDQPFICPACFVEFIPIKWNSLGNKVQEATTTIQLHIVTEWLSQTADNSPVKEIMLEYLDIPNQILSALHCKTLPNTTTSALVRTSSNINHNHERYVDSVEEYVFTVRETAAHSETTTTGVDLTIQRQ